MIQYTSSRATTADAVKGCDYDDTTMLTGYAWAENQVNKGLWCNPEFGDWPLVIIANGNIDGWYFVKEYSEGTIRTWSYAANQVDQYTHHLDHLRKHWAEINK